MNEIGVCVYISYDSLETARIIALLDSEGIPAYTKEDGAGGLFRLYTGHSHSATRIFVPEEAEKDAKLILESFSANDDGSEE